MLLNGLSAQTDKRFDLVLHMQDHEKYLRELVRIGDAHSLNSLTDLEWESAKMLVNAYDGAELNDERVCHLFMRSMDITIGTLEAEVWKSPLFSEVTNILHSANEYSESDAKNE